MLGPRAGATTAAIGDDRLAVAAFTVDGMHHALVAARLSAEFGIGVRHGCFCAHPYLIRLLGVGQRRRGPGTRGGAPGRPQRDPRRGAGQLRARHHERGRRRAARRAARALAAGEPAPVPYVQDGVTGDFWPEGDAGGWSAADRPAGAACAAG